MGIVLVLMSTAVVLSLPAIYRSVGTVVVESQQIPIDLGGAAATSVVSDRIEIIKQRVMTRDKLMEIMKKYPYFNVDGKGAVSISKMLRDVRKNIHIKVMDGEGQNRRNAIAFSVAFDSGRPSIAQSVANDLVSLFLSENLRIRTERASEATTFLKLEAEKIKVELDATEMAVAKFKLEYKESLPEHLSLYTSIRESSRARANQLTRDIRSTQDKISQLESQVQKSPKKNSPEDSINLLRQELAELRLSYTDVHPDVKALKNRIKILEFNSYGQRQGDSNVQRSASLKSKLAKLRADLTSFKAERRALRAEIKDMKERILEIPQVERALVSLNREYTLKEKQYGMLITKARSAEVSESLEEGRKAERFSVIEPPAKPVSPIKPNRLKLFLLGVVFSFGFPVGCILFLGFFNKNIIGNKSLAIVTDIPVIATMPHIYTLQEISFRKRRSMIKLFLVVSFSVVCGASLHYFYMPIDDLAVKAFQRLLLESR